MSTNHPIILFDGTCNFCSFWVKYILKRDKKKVFRLASLQANIGQELLQKHHINSKIDAIVLIEHGRVYIKSTAALRILKTLGGVTAIFYGLIIIPPFVRNFVYDVIAKYRYQWFGKLACEFVPNQHIKDRFLK